MKNLYAYSDEVETKGEKFKAICEANDIDALKEELGFDPYEVTLVDMFAKMLEWGFGIPSSIWDKKLVDITEDEINFVDDCFNQGIIEFKRVE